MSKQKPLRCICYRADGSLIPTDKNGRFDPPLKMPIEIQMEITKKLNPCVDFVWRLEGEPEWKGV